MTKEEVLQLMTSSRSLEEWNENCDKVKAALGDYPDYWYEEVLQSGLMRKTLDEKADQITVSTVPSPERISDTAAGTGEVVKQGGNIVRSKTQ